MTKILSLIDAVRAIRNLPVITEEDTNQNGNKIQRIRINLSLKEAKDMVEDIMALGGAQKDRQIQLLKENERLSYELREAEDKLRETKRSLQYLFTKLN